MGKALQKNEAINQFIGDARSCLWLIETALLRLRDVPKDREALEVGASAARWGHDIAAVREFAEVAGFFKAMESVFSSRYFIDQNNRSHCIPLLLGASQHTGQLVDLIEVGLPVEEHIRQDGLKLFTKLTGIISKHDSAAPSTATQ